MRTAEEIFKQQNPQDGTIPEWAKRLAVSYAKEAIEQCAKNSKVIGRWYDGEFIDYKPISVDKQSILKLINELK